MDQKLFIYSKGPIKLIILPFIGTHYVCTLLYTHRHKQFDVYSSNILIPNSV